MTVRVLPSAWRDLTEIDEWVTQNFGYTYARRTYAHLRKTFLLLADSPNIGKERRDITDLPLRFFFVKPYWIVYQPGSSLAIHRIIHAARDLRGIELIE